MTKKRYDYIAAIWRGDADSNKANVPEIKRVVGMYPHGVASAALARIKGGSNG